MVSIPSPDQAEYDFVLTCNLMGYCHSCVQHGLAPGPSTVLLNIATMVKLGLLVGGQNQDSNLEF